MWFDLVESKKENGWGSMSTWYLVRYLGFIDEISIHVIWVPRLHALLELKHLLIEIKTNIFDISIA